MILVYGGKDHKLDAQIGRWVINRTKMERELVEGTYYAIGVICEKTGRMVAGVLYHDYCKMGSGGRIEMSIAAEDPRWARRKVIGALLHYPFNQLGCHVIISTVKRRNRRARKLAAGLGFVERGIIPNWPYDEDTVIYALRKEDAGRWLSSLAAQKRAA